MKKWIFLIGFLFIPLIIFAQDPEIPADVADLLANLGTFFGSVAGIAGVTIFLTALLVTVIKVEKNWIKMVLGWAVAFVLAVVSNLLNFGYLAEATWAVTLAWGVGFGLIANAIFDIPTTKTLVQFLLSLLSLKKPE